MNTVQLRGAQRTGFANGMPLGLVSVPELPLKFHGPGATFVRINGAHRLGFANGIPLGGLIIPGPTPEPVAARGMFEFDLPILTPLGQDISTLEHLDWNIVDDYRHLAEAIYWRLVTPRGDLFYDLNYGFDVRNYVQAAWSREIQYELEAFSTEECEKDERVLQATVTASQVNAERIKLEVLLETNSGPFKFILDVNALSVEAFGLPSVEPIQQIVKTVKPTIFTAPTVIAPPPIVTPPPTTADVTITVSSVAAITSALRIGVTHMRYSLNGDGDGDSIARAKTLLANAATYQNQHIMGFGADNPWPDKNQPGPYNWGTLDARIQLARDCGSIPVITLCGAPTWMVNASVTDGTDWSQESLESAPLDQFEGAFATLCAAVAARYADVVYFNFWNEMKGLYDPGINNWNFVKYTRMYNLAWNAIKAVRPDAKIGGPYLVIEGQGVSKIGGTASDWYEADPLTQRNRDVLEGWMANAVGKDYILIDRGSHAPGNPNGDAYTQPQILKMLDWFAVIPAQIRALSGFASLPIWYAEDYAWNVSLDVQPSEEFQSAAVAEMLSKELLSGIAVSLRWAPERELDDNGNPSALVQNWFSSTRVSGGGIKTKVYDVYKHFHDRFAPGTVMRSTTSSSPDVVSAIASDTHALLINKSPAQKSVALGSNAHLLAPFEVRLVSR